MNQSARCVGGFSFAVLCIGLVIGTAASASAAPKGKNGPKSAQDVVMEQQELMIRECNLSEDQQKTIKEKFAQKIEALAAWEKANADKVKAAEEATKAARQGSDASAKKTASGTQKELENNRVAATAAADKAILDVLTEEQKATWAGAELAQSTLPRFKKVNLTDDQVAKVKSVCAVAAKELAEFSGDDKKSKQGKSTVQKCLKWAIENAILTADQRATVAPKHAKK